MRVTTNSSTSAPEGAPEIGGPAMVLSALIEIPHSGIPGSAGERSLGREDS